MFPNCLTKEKFQDDDKEEEFKSSTVATEATKSAIDQPTEVCRVPYKLSNDLQYKLLIYVDIHLLD
jgi:hypothetical protein